MLRRRLPHLFSLLAAAGAPCHAFDLVKPLSRGGEAAFTVSITNSTSDDVPSVAFESIPIVGITPGLYVLESLSSPTCQIQNVMLDPSVPVTLSAAPVPARSTVHCSLKMRRSLSSDGPAGLEFKPSANTPPNISLSSIDWIFGPVMDLSLQVEQIRPLPLVGEQVGFVRVAVHNTGPWPIHQVNFGYCQDLYQAPFELENSLPNGCADAGYGPTCWAVGPPAVQFSIEGLARPVRQNRACFEQLPMSRSSNPFGSVSPWSRMCTLKETSSSTTSIIETMMRLSRLHRPSALRWRVQCRYRRRLSQSLQRFF